MLQEVDDILNQLLSKLGQHSGHIAGFCGSIENKNPTCIKRCREIVNLMIYMNGYDFNNGNWQKRHTHADNRSNFDEYLECTVAAQILLRLYGRNKEHRHIITQVSERLEHGEDFPGSQPFEQGLCENINFGPIIFLSGNIQQSLHQSLREQWTPAKVPVRSTSGKCGWDDTDGNTQNDEECNEQDVVITQDDPLMRDIQELVDTGTFEHVKNVLQDMQKPGQSQGKCDIQDKIKDKIKDKVNDMENRVRKTETPSVRGGVGTRGSAPRGARGGGRGVGRGGLAPGGRGRGLPPSSAGSRPGTGPGRRPQPGTGIVTGPGPDSPPTKPTDAPATTQAAASPATAANVPAGTPVPPADKTKKTDGDPDKKKAESKEEKTPEHTDKAGTPRAPAPAPEGSAGGAGTNVARKEPEEEPPPPAPSPAAPPGPPPASVSPQAEPTVVVPGKEATPAPGKDGQPSTGGQGPNKDTAGKIPLETASAGSVHVKSPRSEEDCGKLGPDPDRISECLETVLEPKVHNVSVPTDEPASGQWGIPGSSGSTTISIGTSTTTQNVPTGDNATETVQDTVQRTTQTGQVYTKTEDGKDTLVSGTPKVDMPKVTEEVASSPPNPQQEDGAAGTRGPSPTSGAEGNAVVHDGNDDPPPLNPPKPNPNPNPDQSGASGSGGPTSGDAPSGG
ncbi:hypothetical protein AK88_05353, partial [Plasmodium fragile]